MLRKKLLKGLSVALILSLLVMSFAACGDSGNGSGSGAGDNQNPNTDPAEPGQASDDAAGGEVSYGKTKLAASIPLTGNLMQYGISYRNALEMAVSDFNASGGLGGIDVVLEINDDKGDQTEAINLANKISEDKDVFTVIGSFGSSVSMAAAPIYQKNTMPMVSPNTSHPDYPSMGDMMIPISPAAEVEKVNAVNTFYTAFDGAPMAILYQNTDLGVSAKDIVTELYEGKGGSIVATETFIPAQTKDFTPILSKLKAANPSVIYIEAEYNDAALILIQADQLGMEDIHFCGAGQMFKSEFLDLVGNKADGIILAGSTPVYEDSVLENSDLGEYLTDFTKRYNQLYPDTPCDGFAAAAYDAAMLAMTAARNVGTDDPYALVAEMLTAPIETTCGLNMRYEGNEVFKDLYVYQVIDGQFQNYVG